MAYNKETRERRLKLLSEISKKSVDEIKKEIRERNAFFRKESYWGNARNLTKDERKKLKEKGVKEFMEEFKE